MSANDNYPPGVTGTEPQVGGWNDWEKWADALKPGDACLAFGGPAIVDVFDGDRVWVTRLATGARLLVEWEDMLPPTS